MAVYELDPISRIEGHLGAELTEAGGVITDVKVHGNLWRGFENFLLGREPNDAITFTQRICGVCPVPHGMTATHAVEAAIGYSGTTQFQTPDMTANATGVPARAIHIRNLVLGAEFLMSSLTHFYHLAAPSYVQGPAIPPWTPYFDDNYYHAALRSSSSGVQSVISGTAYAGHGVLPLDTSGFSTHVWDAVIKQYVKALRIRRLTFEAGALFAGRMPMTSCYVAGGVTSRNDDPKFATKCTKYRSLMVEVGNFVVQEYVPLVLALGLLYVNFDNEHNVSGATSGKGWGAGCGNFLAFGGFPKAGVAMDATGVSGNAFSRGWVKKAGGYFGGAQTVGTIAAADVQTKLIEHTKYSRYAQLTGYGYDATSGTSYPYTASRTVPEREKAGAYSYLKAPRWDGDPMEVGPLARLVVMGLYAVDMAAPNNLVVSGGNALQALAFSLYAKVDGATGTGLKPSSVGLDLAIALVRDSLATLKINVDLNALGAVTAVTGTNVWTVISGTGVNNGTFEVGLESAIALGIHGTAYTHSSATIHGAVRDWIVNMKLGLSTMDRLRARALESLYLMTLIVGTPTTPSSGSIAVSWGSGGWLDTLAALGAGATYNHNAYPADGVTSRTGIGAAEAPRGALMHICTIGPDGKIERYQCIVPTTWNACPKDFGSVKGPMEQSIVAPGTGAGFPAKSAVAYAADGGHLLAAAGEAPVDQDTQGGVEALRIAQSFDPCIACAVH